MRYTTTLPKTMLRLFDAFGRVDDKLIRNIPFLITGATGSGYRCAVGEISLGSVSLTVLMPDGALLRHHGPRVKVDVTEESEVVRLANEISEATAAAVSEFSKDNEHATGDPVVQYAYDGEPICYWLSEGEAPEGWFAIANETNATVHERMLGHVDPTLADLIRSSSLTFCHLNLFSRYVMPKATQLAIAKAAKEIPAVIGPLLHTREIITELKEGNDVLEATESVCGIDEEAYRVLGLLERHRSARDETLCPVIASFGRLPPEMLAGVRDAETAERLWHILVKAVGRVMWAFSANYDNEDEYSQQAKGIGALAVRILQRDGLLHEVLNGADPARWDVVTDYIDPYEDIGDFLLQTVVLPHLPSWMFDPAKRAPERSSRLVRTVAANLLVWAGMKEVVKLSNDWTAGYAGDRHGMPREPGEEGLLEMCTALLERAMPGMGPSERAWALVSHMDALSVLDSDGPRVDGEDGPGDGELLEAAE